MALEVGFVDVVAARTGDEDASRAEQAQGPEVDLSVAVPRLLDGALALGEGRRVEDDGVEPLAGVGHLPEQVEDVGLEGRDVVRPLRWALALVRATASAEMSTARTLVALRGPRREQSLRRR